GSGAAADALSRLEDLRVELIVGVILELLQGGASGHQLAAQLLKIRGLVRRLVAWNALYNRIGAGRAALAEARVDIEIPSWSEPIDGEIHQLSLNLVDAACKHSVEENLVNRL